MTKIPHSGKIGIIQFIIFLEDYKYTAMVVTPNKTHNKTCSSWNTAFKWAERIIKGHNSENNRN